MDSSMWWITTRSMGTWRTPSPWIVTVWPCSDSSLRYVQGFLLFCLCLFDCLFFSVFLCFCLCFWWCVELRFFCGTLIFVLCCTLRFPGLHVFYGRKLYRSNMAKVKYFIMHQGICIRVHDGQHTWNKRPWRIQIF